MGVNKPESFNKSAIDRYSDRINGERMTLAEKNLEAAIKALGDTMNPMPGVADQPVWHMDTGSEIAHFLTMLTRDLGRRHNRPIKALDIGTFTGHSAGALARGMDENGGTVISCDITDQYRPIAEQYWKDEGVDHRIDYRIAPAAETLRLLIDDSAQHASFDIAFIDADKTGYDKYYEQALTLLRPGGKIVLDNMLWSGRVTDDSLHDANTDALRNLNAKIAHDMRVNAVLLTAADGIMIVEKQGYMRKAQKALGAAEGRGGI